MFLKVRIWVPSVTRFLGACMGSRWPWTAGNSKYRWQSKLPHLFQSSEVLSVSMTFFSSWEARGQENDGATTFLPQNRYKAGVINPGDSLQPEVSQNQTCMALIWKMRILTLYLENYIGLFSTTSNEESGKKYPVYNGGFFPVKRLIFYSNNWLYWCN